jgi:hypothetical protein
LGNAIKFSNEGGAVELHVELLRREADDEDSIQELDTTDDLIETDATQKIDKSEADEAAGMKVTYDSDSILLGELAGIDAVASEPTRPSRCPFTHSEEDLTHSAGASRCPFTKPQGDYSTEDLTHLAGPSRCPFTKTLEDVAGRKNPDIRIEASRAQKSLETGKSKRQLQGSHHQ